MLFIFILKKLCFPKSNKEKTQRGCYVSTQAYSYNKIWMVRGVTKKTSKSRIDITMKNTSVAFSMKRYFAFQKIPILSVNICTYTWRTKTRTDGYILVCYLSCTDKYDLFNHIYTFVEGHGVYVFPGAMGNENKL